MANSLYPAFVEIGYHSAFGAHVQTVPTLAWTPGGSGFGTFATHGGGTVDADTMIMEFIEAEEVFFPATVSFDWYVIYTMADPEAPALPRAQKFITEVGSATDTAINKATQGTWSFRTDEFGQFKLVMLDIALGSFTKITNANTTAAMTALIAIVTDEDNGWAGRDGGKPTFFSQIAFTLNEKLRREYGMN